MQPHRVRAVALSEFRAMLRSRVFLLSLILVPALSLGLGLFARSVGSGAASNHQRGDGLQLVLPLASMVLLFAMVMLTTPQMMSAVIEEKMTRVSEILLSSISAFDLMAGKLLACCGAAAVVGAVYGALGWGLAVQQGLAHSIPGSVLAGFALLLPLAVLMHGALFMAVGAACSSPKDAQGMLAPLVLASSLPLIGFPALARDPHGPLALGLSFFPLSSPFVMAFRLSSVPPPPPSQVVLAVGLSLLSAVLCVWAAARIFRVGLLAQGRSPGLRQLWRWVFLEP